MIDLAIHVSDNKNEKWATITLKGELDDYQSSKLTESLNELIDKKRRYMIVLDLSHVTFIDSVGLGAVAIAAKKLQEHAGRLNIVTKHDTVQKMVTMSGMISATGNTMKLCSDLTSSRE